MPRNGSGVYSPPAASYPAVSGTLIESSKRNAVDADIATAITNSIAVNGESVVTNNIPLGGNKLTGVGAATARTDAMTLANAQDGTGVYVATVGGTADVITISPNPSIAAYVAGQMFSFIASGANTTNVTINVSGLGAKAITKNGATALVAGDIPSGFLVSVRYDGTRFQLVGAKDSAFSGGTVANATTFSSSVTVTGATDLNGALTIDGGATATTDITMTAATIKLAKGADVASATALPLITDGNYFDVTGTTTITSFNSMGVGTWIRLHFDGALTLTHQATDLILPSGANITTAAGDEAEFIEYASGDWRCVSYTKASGAPIAGGITSGTAIATTSGTSHDFTGIPSTVKRITIMLDGVSTNGTSDVIIQLGDSGGVETTGYLGSTGETAQTGSGTTSFTTGIGVSRGTTSATVREGTITILNLSGNKWVASVTTSRSDAAVAYSGSSTKSLSAVLTQIRLTTVNGTDTFDAGSVNILYE